MDLFSSENNSVIGNIAKAPAEEDFSTLSDDTLKGIRDGTLTLSRRCNDDTPVKTPETEEDALINQAIKAFFSGEATLGLNLRCKDDTPAETPVISEVKWTNPPNWNNA